MLIGDMVVQTANAPGTGTFNLIAPPSGRSSFVASAGAGQVFYFAEDSSSWEKGYGTVTSGSPDTLSRDTVIGNSLGTTAKVNFAGSVTIICDIPAERALFASADNSKALIGNRRLDSVAAALSAGDGPRFDQIAWPRLGSADTAASGSSAIIYSLPSGYARFRASFAGLTSGSGSNVLFVQVSTNNRSSWDTSSSYLTKQVGGSVVTANSIVIGSSGIQNNEGYFEINPSSKKGFWFNAVNTSGTIDTNVGSFLYSGSGTPTDILIATGATFTGGSARLEAWKTF